MFKHCIFYFLLNALKETNLDLNLKYAFTLAVFLQLYCQVGNWEKFFTPDKAEEWASWIKEKTAGTGLAEKIPPFWSETGRRFLYSDVETCPELHNVTDMADIYICVNFLEVWGKIFESNIRAFDIGYSFMKTDHFIGVILPQTPTHLTQIQRRCKIFGGLG